MKKLIYILIIPLFISCYQETNLDFLFNGSIAVNGSDTLLVDSITGTFDTDYVLTFVDFDIALGYLPGKTAAKLNGQPICTFFQNANYADTSFAQWLDQELNADSTENKPFRIQRIAHYSIPTVDVNNFFQTPPKGIGLDVGVGKTYTTIPTALTASIAGDTVYVYDGTYTDVTHIDMNKADVSLINVGNAILGDHGLSYTALLRNHNLVFKGFTMLPAANGENLFVNTNVLNTLITNNYMETDGVYSIRTSTGSQPSIINNVIIQTTSTSPSIHLLSQYVNIQGNLFDGDQLASIRNLSNADSIIAKYNSFNADGFVFDNAFTLDSLEFSFNDILNTSSNIIINNSGATNSYIRHNTASTTQRFLLQETGEGFVYLYNNIITSNSSSAIIQVNSSNIDILSNTLDQNGSGFNILLSKFTTKKRFNISNNIITNETSSLVVIGEEASPNDSNYLYGVISENEIIGNTTPGLSQHAVFIYNNDSIDISHNNITLADLSIVLKSNDVDYSDVRVWGNIMDHRLTLKGCKNSNFYQNHVVIQSGDDYCINSTINGSVNSTGNKIYNNILFTNAPDTITGAGIITMDTGETVDINYNQIYSSGGLKIAQIGATPYDWSGWQGLGNDPNSFNTDPNFAGVDSLWVVYPSDAIGNALNLGTPYDSVLRVGSVWTDSIFKKQQFTRWSMGAYIPEIDTLDSYASDTTMGIWSNTFNQAKWIYNNSTDTIIIGVDNFETWSIKENEFIDLVGNDSIIYGTDNFETWRTKFNNSADSANAE